MSNMMLPEGVYKPLDPSEVIFSKHKNHPTVWDCIKSRMQNSPTLNAYPWTFELDPQIQAQIFNRRMTPLALKKNPDFQ